MHGLYTKPELEADSVPKCKPPVTGRQAAELDTQSRMLHDTDEAILPRQLEIRESSTSTSVVVKDQEPRPQSVASWGVMSRQDDSVASLPKDAAARDSGDMNEEESEEELRQRIIRAKEERERLARIDELSRLEARLETNLAAKKPKGGDR